jgi:hypothetical protein
MRQESPPRYPPTRRDHCQYVAARAQVDFNECMSHEKAISRSLGGRTVFDRPSAKSASRQLSLFIMGAERLKEVV